MSDDAKPTIVGKLGYCSMPDGSVISILVPLNDHPQMLNLTTGEMRVMKPTYGIDNRYQ